MHRRLGLIAAIPLALALAGCGGLPTTAAPSSTPAPSPTPTLPTLNVTNGTTVPVTIVVNSTVIATVPAGASESPINATLPDRPWTIEARSPSGRVLATMTVSARDYISTTSGIGVREDLSCGRLDIWSGPPLLGGTFIADPSKPCD